MARNHLFVMVKEPHAGRVKTRLGRDIGMTGSAWWFRHQTQRLLRAVAHDPRWSCTLAVSPDSEGLASRVWPADLPRCAQGRGNLGDRMARIFRHGPVGRTVIIGADIPGITPARIARAFACLGDHDAVFGPAPDGGYWLIGLHGGAKPVPKTLFRKVRWSTEHALDDTRASLGRARVALIDALRDVDTVSDLLSLPEKLR